MIPIAKPIIGDAEKEKVMQVLESGILAQGEMVEELERKFAAVCQVKHAIATTSGTTALHLALLAHHIGPGDEVITSPFTFIASVNSIIYVGATPVLVDIDEETFNLNPALVEAAITPRTRAILPVHLYGYPCDMAALMDIADRHNLVIVEDAAQAIGATYQGRPIGSFGTACFSLYATKNIMSGEGGVITTDDDHIAHCLRMLRSHGMQRRYHHELLGYNFRLSNLHAAIGSAQMDRLAEFTEKRRANAAYLNDRLESVIVPLVKLGYGHVWHQYTVRAPDDAPFSRDQAVEKLTQAGIGTGIFYPVPAHQQSYIQETYGVKHLPVAEKMARQVISLPVHPLLTPADLDAIVQAVNNL
jgi:dTDP-4-amino-4,6-dideoxygalactose transaminase